MTNVPAPPSAEELERLYDGFEGAIADLRADDGRSESGGTAADHPEDEDSAV